MIHQMAQNGCWLLIRPDAESGFLGRLLNQDFWAELTFLYKSEFWQNFAMTFP
jgi:hypothetical protein